MPTLLVYSTCKRFVSHLAIGLNFELEEHQIDVLAYNPSGVATKMAMKDKQDASWAVITPERAAEVCFRDLGKTPMTYGAFSHEL